MDILYWQLHMEVNCVLLSIYTFILHLYVIPMPFLFKQQHSMSDTLFPLLLLDILTTDYFFTSFYLMMLLQNNPLVQTREFFAQSTLRM